MRSKPKLKTLLISLFFMSLFFVLPAPLEAQAKVPQKSEYNNYIKSFYRHEELGPVYTDALTKKQKQKTLEEAIKIVKKAPKAKDKAVKFFHDEICGKCSYAADPENKNRTAYGALVSGKTNCMGYTHAMSLLCDLADIPWYEVTGSTSGASRGQSHMWNLVQLQDGKWYEIDVTWDDETSRTTHDYFLLTTRKMSKNHFRNENYGPYPTAEGTKYAYKESSTSAETFVYKNCTYKILKSKQVQLTQAKNAKGNFIIPETVSTRVNGATQQYKVTSIGEGAFKDNAKIKAVKIDSNIKSIDKAAFDGCSKLTEVEMSGSTVKKLPEDCFKGCLKLEKLTVNGNALKSVHKNVATGANTKCKVVIKYTKNEKNTTLVNSLKKAGLNRISTAFQSAQTW